ncbi:MAG: FtsQ-type POTRA domain-containing protein [Candidatus Binatia bacterium]|nr:FtsQ-type POTRA domain-containing protein [Candidatus Binatia bacterium]
MKLRQQTPRRRRRKAVIERRFTFARLVENAWAAAKQPRNTAFLGSVVLLCFTAGPVMRYCMDHRYFAVRGVEVRGTERLSALRVRSWLGMVEGRSIWRTSPRDLEASLRRYPPIADAHVRRILPDRIEVTVEERVPDVVVRDKRGFFLADVDGVLFEMARPGAGDLPELPIVTVARGDVPADPELLGPPAPGADPSLGDASRLPVRVLGETIALAARLEGGHGGIGVSEVTIEPGALAGDDPDLLVFSTDGQLSVRLGWGSWDAKLVSLSRVVSHAARSGHAAPSGLSGRLDVRDPEAVVAQWAPEGTA